MDMNGESTFDRQYLGCVVRMFLSHPDSRSVPSKEHACQVATAGTQRSQYLHKSTQSSIRYENGMKNRDKPCQCVVVDSDF